MPTFTLETAVTGLKDFFRVFYKDILSKYSKSQLLKDIFPTYGMVEDEIVFTEAEVSEIMQGYQKGWTPKGSMNFTPEIGKVYRCKADITVSKDELMSTYLASYNTSDSGLDENSFIVKTFIEKSLERYAKDTDFARVNGKYKNPTSGKASSATDSLNGLFALLSEKVTLGKIKPYEFSESLDETNTVSELVKMYKTLPTDFKNSLKKICYVSQSVYDNYLESYEATYGTVQTYKDSDRRFIKNTNCPLIVVPFVEKDFVLFTIEGNIVLLEKMGAYPMSFEIQKDKRELCLLIDSKAGIGIKIVGNVNNPYIHFNKFEGCPDFKNEE